MRTRVCAAALLTGLLSAGFGSPAAASVTLGELAPGVPTSCSASFDFLQLSSPGNTYAMPAAGVVTSWTHKSQVGMGQEPTLKVFRKTGDPMSYAVVGHDGPHPIAATSTETFSASIPVQAGDVLGITGAGGANIGCQFGGTVGETGFRSGNLADGAFGDFASGGTDERLNLTAVLEPTSTFTLAKPGLNRKKGTATLTATVPNPGTLVASGKGVRASGLAASSKVVAAGTVRLVVRAKGRQRKKLNDTGAVKVKLNITFTPVSGQPSTLTRKLKLKKNV
jgi:hypothetical protein